MKHQCPICKKTVKSPPCGKPQKDEFYPFCSSRCKLIDLGAWLDEKYTIISKLTSEKTEKSPDNSS